MKPFLARASLRIRLLAGTLFWIVASIIVAGWGLSSLFHQHVAMQFHSELQTHLDQLTAQLSFDEQGRPILSSPVSDPRLRRPYSGLYWQIDDLAGKAGTVAGALRSRSLWDDVLVIHQHRVTGPGGTLLGMVERTVGISDGPDTPSHTFRLIVAADERLMLQPVARFNDALWLALGVLGAGLVIAALVQVIVGLAPLRKLRTALERVREGATPRLEGEFPAEVTPLVDEFNTVLAQNGEVVKRARTQAGNLAHALKTPLSVLANAAAGRDDELAGLVAAQVAEANRQVHYHLARSQAAAAVHLPGARTPLRPVLEGLLRTMHRIHAARPLELLLQPMPETLAFRGDEQDLQEMLGNLLDNACKWADRRVDIHADLDGQSLSIRVDDDGRGLAASARDAVLRRGVRADQQVQGSGLGLSIVDDLARLHGGTLMLADSPLGGLRVLLTLPAS